MGIYIRPDSKYWWMALERVGRRPIRRSTRVPKDGATPGQRRDQKVLATQIYNARMGDLARQRNNIPIDLPSRSFDEHAAWYGATISPTKGGTVKELSMIRQLQKYGWSDVAELSDATIEDGYDWRAERAEDVAFSTVNREMALLKHIFSTAVPKYIPTNPLAGLSELEGGEVEMRILAPDEEGRLLGACDDAPEDYALIVCGLDTLQRLGSVTTVRWKDDLGDQLRFLTLKVGTVAGKGHHVEMSSRLRRALDQLRATLEHSPAPTDPIFANFYDQNDQRRRKLVWQMMLERCAAAGIPTNRLEGGVSFHALRHTGATRMLDRGIDPKTVMEIGGWKRIEQVMKYVHTNRETKREAVELVSGSRAVHVADLRRAKREEFLKKNAG